MPRPGQYSRAADTGDGPPLPPSCARPAGVVHLAKPGSGQGIDVGRAGATRRQGKAGPAAAQSPPQNFAGAGRLSWVYEGVWGVWRE